MDSVRTWRAGRFGGLRFAAAPLAVWLLLTTAGIGTLHWAGRSSRQELTQRFELRGQLGAGFVKAYTDDLLAREQVQARTYLTDAVVDDADFVRSVAAFGYPAAVLVGPDGRLSHVVPANPALIGQDVTRRYDHLDRALRDGVPVVSPVVASAARGVPVVAFAVPFETPSGRRVFSGAVEVQTSPLSAFLANALPYGDARVFLVDSFGAIVAAGRDHPPGVTPLSAGHPELARAVGQAANGTYDIDGTAWRYTSSPVLGTPWQVAAAVPESTLYGPVRGTTVAGTAALAAAALVGLIAVAASARAARERRELRASEERFRDAFDNSQLGMALIDPGDRFRRVNRALCRMLGYRIEDLLGRGFIDVTHPEDVRTSLAAMRSVVAGLTSGFSMEQRYLHADGHAVPTLVTAGLIRDAGGRPLQLATQVMDLTDRKRLEAERESTRTALADHARAVEQTNADLIEAQARMADFIAMLSHDVRQPLTSIGVYTELLREHCDDLVDPDAAVCLDRIDQANHRLQGLVSDILTIAQLDAGVVAARVVSVDAREAVREAVDALTPDIARTVAVIAPDNIDVVVDPGHFQQILANLIGNAVKYGAPPIEVTVTPSGSHVQVRVCDHGEGVPQEFVPHLFDRFARAQTGVALAKPGTGLGLYIVRTLALANRAVVDYRPNRPSGACFVVRLTSVGRTGDALSGPVLGTDRADVTVDDRSKIHE